MGAKEAIIINIVRIIVIGLLFGNLFSILFSISGAVLSLLFMYIAKKTKLFSLIAVSIVGGITHNAAQLVVASFVVKTYSILYYIPILIITGVITGLVIGIVANLVKDKIKHIMEQIK